MKIKKIAFVLSRIFLFFWLLSIVVFFYTAFKLDSTRYYGQLMGGSLVTGVVSFVMMIASALISQDSKTISTDKHNPISKNVKYKPTKESPSTKFAMLGIIILLLISVYLNYKHENLIANQKSENQKLIDSQKNINDYQLFGKINEYRQSEKLQTFSQDDEVCKVANDRLENHFWQTNLKLEDYDHLCPKCNTLFVAESQDNNDTSSILEKWKANDSTLKTLKSNSRYGCVKAKENKVVFVAVSKSETVQKTQNNVASDPVVDCVSSAPNCNGESIRLKQSLCKNITCCQIGNTWSVYSSSDKCKQAQQSTQPIQAQKPTQATGGLNFYCYDNTNNYSYYTSSGEQCNKDNAISSCRGSVKITYDMCMQSCLNTANEGTDICVWGYGAGGNVEDNSDLLQQCFDENSVEHKSCMDGCSKPYQENSAKCNY